MRGALSGCAVGWRTSRVGKAVPQLGAVSAAAHLPELTGLQRRPNAFSQSNQPTDKSALPNQVSKVAGYRWSGGAERRGAPEKGASSAGGRSIHDRAEIRIKTATIGLGTRAAPEVQCSCELAPYSP